LSHLRRFKKFTFVVSETTERNEADLGRSRLLHISEICLIDRLELALIAHNYNPLHGVRACYGCDPPDVS